MAQGQVKRGTTQGANENGRRVGTMLDATTRVFLTLVEHDGRKLDRMAPSEVDVYAIQAAIITNKLASAIVDCTPVEKAEPEVQS